MNYEDLDNISEGEINSAGSCQPFPASPPDAGGQQPTNSGEDNSQKPWDSLDSDEPLPSKFDTRNIKSPPPLKKQTYSVEDEIIYAVTIKIYESGKLKAFVDLNLFGHFIMKGFKVMDGEYGLWVSMPARKNEKTEEWDDIFSPESKQFKKRITKLILETYQKIKGRTQASDDEIKPLELNTCSTEADPGRKKLNTFQTVKKWSLYLWKLIIGQKNQ